MLLNWLEESSSASASRSPALRSPRVLTNGSLAVRPPHPPDTSQSGSECGSAGLTASTLDESQSSDGSSEFYNNYSTRYTSKLNELI